MVAGDAVLESNVASSSLRDRPYNEHDTGSVKADDLQGAGWTAPVINTLVFDEAPLSTVTLLHSDHIFIGCGRPFRYSRIFGTCSTV
jgi:hypothetical protein